jgi:hypothetical protein
MASPVYVPIYANWIPPHNSGNITPQAPLWFESDTTEKGIGPGLVQLKGQLCGVAS